MRGVIGVGILGLLSVGWIPGTAADPSPPGAPVGHVVVVGVAGLRWEDITTNGTPNLSDLVETGSVGTLSVRSAPAVSCPSEGWLTLGAGSYAAVSDPGAIDPERGCAARPIPPVRAAPDHHGPVAASTGHLGTAPGTPGLPGSLGPGGGGASTVAAWPASTGGGGAVVSAMPEVVALNRGLRHGADAGWLASQIGCVTAVGEGAALAAAAPDGAVASYASALPGSAGAGEGTGEDHAAGSLLAQCPVTLVDGGALADTGGRAASLRRVDDLVGRVDAALSPSTVLMVLGVAETDAQQARLHAAVVTGPGFQPGYLASASTHRVPYVQLVDVAPTILALLGQPFADTVAGRPFVGDDGHPPSELAAVRAELVDTDRQAVAQRSVLGWFFAGLTTTVVVVTAALLWVLRRHSRSLACLRMCAVGLTGVPAAIFLANLVPWWQAPAPWPGLAVGAAVGCGATVILGVAWLATRTIAPRPERTRAQLGVVATVTVLVLAVDGVSGSSLQIGSLLGYNPLVAGRFVGFGNIAFAVLGAGAVILGALMAHGRGRLQSFAAVTAVALPVIVLDGWPGWGADFGGVLSLTPTFVVLALLVTRTRITGWRLTLAAAAGGVMVGGIAALDYLRPPQARTHFGRFVDTLLHGGSQGHDAFEVVERKLLANWELLFMGPHTVVALGLTTVLVLVVVRPPALLRHAYQVHHVLQPLVCSTVVLALVGFATNDSGIAIPAVVALVTGPATLALCASVRDLDTPAAHRVT